MALNLRLRPEMSRKGGMKCNRFRHGEAIYEKKMEKEHQEV